MLCMKQKKELEILYNTDIIMTEERIKIGLRIFSEGKEWTLEPEEKRDDTMWEHTAKCPHCKKSITIIKWIYKIIEFKNLD